MIPATSFLLFTVVVILFAIPSHQKSNPIPTYVEYYCLDDAGNYTQASTYQLNLNNTLSLLQLNSNSSLFYETSTGEASDNVYGRYYCRHDLSESVCSSCVHAATKTITSECPYYKEALVWYEQCTLLYLTNSSRLVGINDASPFNMWYTPRNVTDPDKFYPVLQSTIKRVINESAYGQESDGFATEEGRVSSFLTLYTLAQCSPDRIGLLCEQCLTRALRKIDICCNEYADMAFFYPSCQLRFSVLGPFYDLPSSQPGAPPPPPPPPTVVFSSPPPPTNSYQSTTGNWAIGRNKNVFNYGAFIALIILILLAN